MRFGIVDPIVKKVWTVEAKELQDVYQSVSLKSEIVDHGTIYRTQDGGGVSIVVYEFALFVKPEFQHYFSMRGKLFAGRCVLYGFGIEGETVDLPPGAAAATFYGNNVAEIEAAFNRRALVRPVVSHNGHKIWQWPDPYPMSDDIKARMKKAGYTDEQINAKEDGAVGDGA
jgi:hypothetical protein